MRKQAYSDVDFVRVNDASLSARITVLEKRVTVGRGTAGINTEVAPKTPFILGYQTVKSKLRATMAISVPTGTIRLKVVVVPTASRVDDATYQANKLQDTIDLDTSQSDSGTAEIQFGPLLKFATQYDLVKLVAIDEFGGRTKNPDPDPIWSTAALVQFTTPAGSDELTGSGTTNGITYMTSSSDITSTAAPTDGQFLIGRTGLAPVLGTVSGTANRITITLGAGTITANAPQDLHSGASNFTVTGATISGLTAKSFIYTGASSVLASTAAPTNGQLLIGSTGNVPVAAALTGTTNQVTVTNGAGSITLSTPQNLHTSADFQVSTLAATTSTTIGSGTAITKVISASASLNFAQLLALASETLTLTVTGAVDGDSVFIGVPNALVTHNTSSGFFAWVSAADTVSVRRWVLTADGSDPAAATVRATVFKF